MKEQEAKGQNQATRSITLSELNVRPGRIVRDVLRTQKPTVITEYGQEVAEIRPLESTEPKK